MDLLAGRVVGLGLATAAWGVHLVVYPPVLMMTIFTAASKRAFDAALDDAAEFAAARERSDR